MVPSKGKEYKPILAQFLLFLIFYKHYHIYPLNVYVCIHVCMTELQVFLSRVLKGRAAYVSTITIMMNICIYSFILVSLLNKKILIFLIFLQLQ